MKKAIYLLTAIVAIFVVTACGSGSTTNGTNDSTTVKTDTVKVDTTKAVVDTTVKLK